MSKQTKLLERLVVALETQAAIMVRSDARIQEQMDQMKKDQAERQEVIKKMFGEGVRHFPGLSDDEPDLVLDPDGDIDPKKTRH